MIAYNVDFPQLYQQICLMCTGITMSYYFRRSSYSMPTSRDHDILAKHLDQNLGRHFKKIVMT